MARIKIKDLARDKKIGKKEMRMILGGSTQLLGTSPALRRGVVRVRFEDPLTAFEDPLTAFEDPLTAFEDPLTARRR